MVRPRTVARVSPKESAESADSTVPAKAVDPVELVWAAAVRTVKATYHAVASVRAWVAEAAEADLARVAGGVVDTVRPRIDA